MFVPQPSLNAGRARWIAVLEWASAGLVTLLLIDAHLIFRQSAGPLWRDEINTCNVSQQPTAAEVWALMRWDSCPPAWPWLLRGAQQSGLCPTDDSLRGIGLVLGLGILAMLWCNARRIGQTFPFCSLVLIAANPAVLCYGDSLRAYGLGSLTMLVVTLLVWNLVRAPTWWRTALALATCMLAVNSAYYNSVMLLALCIAGAVAGLCQRNWRIPLLLFVVGGGAACSLYLLDWQHIISSREWNEMVKQPVTAASLLGWFTDTVNLSAQWAVYAWCGVFVAALAGHMRVWAATRQTPLDPVRQRSILFFTLALAVPACYLAFLLIVSYPTTFWYYVSIMTFLAASLDIGLESLAVWTPGRRIVRIGLFLILAALLLPTTYRKSGMRMTNVDLIAQVLEKHAGPRDLIVIYPWWPGISFQRYYHGPTPWTTLPRIRHLLVHRMDELKEKMTAEDAIREELTAIESTLKRGNRVWIVGSLDFNSAPGKDAGKPADEIVRLPPAPNAPTGWLEGPYLSMWSQEASSAISKHAQQILLVELPHAELVNQYEDLPLFVAVPR